jgi:hypothetical protein
VIDLTQRRAWPECKTLGDLVGFANTVPEGAIMPMVMAELHELERVHRAGQAGSAAMQRHAVVAGSLLERLCFEVYGLPQQARADVPAA